MTSKSVKLIGDIDNPRINLFSSILKELENYHQTGRVSSQISTTANYNIIFNFNDLDKLKNLNLPINPNSKENFIIYDVTEDLFDTRKWGPITTLLTVCSSFVTCSNEYLQERIYEVTGRLAAIVRNPLDTSKVVEPKVNSNTKQFLWYGSLSDIFSVYPFRDQENLTIACTNGSHPAAVRINSSKKKDKLLEKYDVVFLPETSSIEGELRRFEKIKEATLLGKTIIEKLDEKLPTKKKMVENTLKAQQTLLEEEGFDTIVKQLEYALEAAPKDDFLDFMKEMSNTYYD